MLGSGPTITFKEKTCFWLNGEKHIQNDENLSFSCRDLPEGIYRLKVINLPPEKFYIQNTTYLPFENNGGWLVNRYSGEWKYNAGNFQVEGLHINFPIEEEKVSVRTWISANLSVKKNKEQNSLIVFRAINRAKHGI
jgi:hypothetical protein